MSNSINSTSRENSTANAYKDLMIRFKDVVNTFLLDITIATESVIKSIAVLERDSEEIFSGDITAKTNNNSSSTPAESIIKEETIIESELFIAEQQRSEDKALIFDEPENAAVRSERTTEIDGFAKITPEGTSLLVSGIKIEPEDENVTSETTKNIIVSADERPTSAQDFWPEDPRREFLSRTPSELHKNDGLEGDIRLHAQSHCTAKKRLLENSVSGTSGREPAANGKEGKSKKDKKIISEEEKDKSSEGKKITPQDIVEKDLQKSEKSNEANLRKKRSDLTITISYSNPEAKERKLNASQEKIDEKKCQFNSDKEKSPQKKKQQVRKRVLSCDSVDKKSSPTGSNPDSLDERSQTSSIKRIKTERSDSNSINDRNRSQGTSQNPRTAHEISGDKQVADDSQRATQKEKEVARIEGTEIKVPLLGKSNVHKLVLDFDKESKEPRISVKEGLVERLKPHQVEGVKFMWNACFGSLEEIKRTKGSGCILAHCSGLGKRFQVLTLLHTLLANTETGIKTALIVGPKYKIFYWTNDFKIWLQNIEDANKIKVYEMPQEMGQSFERQLESWHETGGIMIIAFTVLEFLAQKTVHNQIRTYRENVFKCLIDPGPDLIVCDENRLNNKMTKSWQAVKLVKTQRRIVITSLSLLKNLAEYYSMTQFVNPNILGTKVGFNCRFLKPITNGRRKESTKNEIELMKIQTQILHLLLEGTVQRFDHSVITSLIPPKQEYVILLKLSELQIRMYQHFIDKYARKERSGLPVDFECLQKICTSAYSTVPIEAEQVERENKGVRLRTETQRWTQNLKERDYVDIKCYSKLLILFKILKKCEQIGDKVLVFWNNPCSLELIETFLNLINTQTQKQNEANNLDSLSGSWSLGLDYFKLEGQVGVLNSRSSNRRQWCDMFSDSSNTRARLFLISSKLKDFHYNFTAANRVVIFEASYYPTRDVDNILRVCRIGQKKPCYVYRLLAAGTIEEKMYNQRVIKLPRSCCVVDKAENRKRRTKMTLDDLYQLEVPGATKNILHLPNDKLLAEIFLECKDVIENYHEHDSLLNNEAL